MSVARLRFYVVINKLVHRDLSGFRPNQFADPRCRVHWRHSRLFCVLAFPSLTYCDPAFHFLHWLPKISWIKLHQLKLLCMLFNSMCNVGSYLVSLHTDIKRTAGLTSRRINSSVKKATANVTPTITYFYNHEIIMMNQASTSGFSWVVPPERGKKKN